MTQWWSKYIGLPFVDKGRDQIGCDCYGLVRLVYFEQLGIDLPLLCEGYERTNEREQIAQLVSDQPLLIGFEPVALDDVKPFDVLVIRQAGVNCHLGVVVSSGRVLHTEKNINAVVDDYTRPHLKPRIREAWRYVK